MNRLGILTAAMLAFAPLFAAAQVKKLTCDDVRIAETEFCSLLAAETRRLQTSTSAFPRLHDIVGGSYSVLQDAGEAVVQGYSQPIVLPGQTFLTGRLRTDCLLAQLPFAGASGAINLVPLTLDGLGEARALSITTPRPSDPHSAGLSCDGQRLYVFDYEYDGLTVFDVGTEDRIRPENWSEDQTIAVVSHTGRYVAALGEKPGTYVMQDFLSGNQIIFDASVELDYPFFSANDEHLFIVRNPDETARTEIFSLPHMALLTEIPGALPNGVPMVFENSYLITADPHLSEMD
ncbi:hypothetical protein AADZ90_000130 [Aestuariibius sp. 2305UL40-4]|uniref:hypothetical protein n=1 Tax=Aestuariibius violaceus TaxID=3234132 RepID=UPI00345E2F64